MPTTRWPWTVPLPVLEWTVCAIARFMCDIIIASLPLRQLDWLHMKRKRMSLLPPQVLLPLLCLHVCQVFNHSPSLSPLTTTSICGEALLHPDFLYHSRVARVGSTISHRTCMHCYTWSLPGKADRVWSSAVRFRGASREKNLQHKLQQSVIYYECACVHVCLLMWFSLYTCIYRHQLIQHGQGATEGHSQLLPSVARQCRMEQLRHVYAVRVGERGKEEGEVDQLLQWTRSLDSAVLTTPQPLATPL